MNKSSFGKYNKSGTGTGSSSSKSKSNLSAIEDKTKSMSSVPKKRVTVTQDVEVALIGANGEIISPS